MFYDDKIYFSKRYNSLRNPEGVQKYVQSGEIFIEVTTDMVPGVYDYYQISNYGRVYHNYLDIIMKPGTSTSGYKFIIMSTDRGPKPIQLHRLVLIAFNDIPNRDEYQVNHINGNKTKNYIWNLEWVTRRENVLHAYQTGLQKIGEEHWNSTISDEVAYNICTLLEKNQYTNNEIAEMLNVSPYVVNDIKKSQSWKHVSCNFTFIQRPGKLFTKDQIHNICKYFELYDIGNLTVNDHCRNALAYYNYDTSDRYIDSVRKIYNHKYYTNISQNYNF